MEVVFANLVDAGLGFAERSFSNHDNTAERRITAKPTTGRALPAVNKLCCEHFGSEDPIHRETSFGSTWTRRSARQDRRLFQTLVRLDVLGSFEGLLLTQSHLLIRYQKCLSVGMPNQALVSTCVFQADQREFAEVF